MWRFRRIFDWLGDLNKNKTLFFLIFPYFATVAGVACGAARLRRPCGASPPLKGVAVVCEN